MQRSCSSIISSGIAERPLESIYNDVAYDSRHQRLTHDNDAIRHFEYSTGFLQTSLKTFAPKASLSAHPKTIDPSQIFTRSNPADSLRCVAAMPLACSMSVTKQKHCVDPTCKYPSPTSDVSASSTPSSGSATATSASCSDAELKARQQLASMHQLTLPKMIREPAYTFSYVDSLVDVATLVVDSLWPSASGGASSSTNTVLSYFITETSRKSKTSLSTMQLTLFYCLKFKQQQIGRMTALRRLYGKSDPGSALIRATTGSNCARRNFLSALVLASKYLQDRNFSNKAWSKISSVSVADINLREREFLEVVQWRLDVKQDLFKNWTDLMERMIGEIRDRTMFGSIRPCKQKWRSTILNITTLSSIDVATLQAQLRLHDLQDEATQLLTPLPSPGENDSSFDFTRILIDTDISQPCLFFEEFVRSSPKLVGCDAIELGAGNYATPESLHRASPTSSEDDNSFVLGNDSSQETLPMNATQVGLPERLPQTQSDVEIHGIKRTMEDDVRGLIVKRGRTS